MTPLLLCLPLLLEIGQVKPAALFQEFYNPKLRISGKRVLGFIPAILGTYGLSVWQSHSFWSALYSCITTCISLVD